MKSAVETLSPTRVRLTVDVPFEELRPELDKAYREIAKQVNIPGFRKGKVPPPVIDRQVGREFVLEQAINEALPKAYVASLQENDIEPLGEPDLNFERGEDGADLQFTAEVDVRPQIELPDYSGLEVSVDDIVVSDEDVEQQLQGLRERFGTLKAAERAAQDGDFITLDLETSKDGNPIEDAQLKGHSYKVGSKGLVDGLDDAVVGKAAGESGTFVSRLVAGEFADQDVDMKVTVTAVKEQELPELDDDFAQLASEFDTLEELTADLRERSERGKRVEQAGKAQEAVLEKLSGLTEIPLPEKVVEARAENRRQELEHQLGHIGQTLEAYLEHEEMTLEEFDADGLDRVRQALKAEFILDKVADAEGVSVDQNELTQHLLLRAQQEQMQPDEFVNQIVQNGLVPVFVREVRRNKALALIVEQADVRDASGSTVELKRLRPDGTYEPEAAEAPEGSEESDEDKTDEQAPAEDAEKA